MEFLESFKFTYIHKSGKEKIVVDALPRRYTVLSILEAMVLRFHLIQAIYKEDPDSKP